ncbi:MAG: hypothetical protein BECKG1743D_GA0114223_103041, partial [Candidatus Kentron sp. G]
MPFVVITLPSVGAVHLIPQQKDTPLRIRRVCRRTGLLQFIRRTTRRLRSWAQCITGTIDNEIEGFQNELSDQRLRSHGAGQTGTEHLSVTARVISGVASHIQVEETEALHVSRIALMVRGYLRSECVKE